LEFKKVYAMIKIFVVLYWNRSYIVFGWVEQIINCIDRWIIDFIRRSEEDVLNEIRQWAYSKV